MQNYKLITQPAGKAALKETQARKVRNGDTGNFSHSPFVFLPPVFPKTVRYDFSSISLASQQNSSSRCSFQSTYSVSISFLISGRSQWTQVVLHPFQGQTHICIRGALGEKNYGTIWEPFLNGRSTSSFWEPLVQINLVFVKIGKFGTIPI